MEELEVKKSVNCTNSTSSVTSSVTIHYNCIFDTRELRVPEYMLQSRESSWGFPSTLQTFLNLSLVNVKDPQQSN